MKILNDNIELVSLDIWLDTRQYDSGNTKRVFSRCSSKISLLISFFVNIHEKKRICSQILPKRDVTNIRGRNYSNNKILTQSDCSKQRYT